MRTAKLTHLKEVSFSVLLVNASMQLFEASAIKKESRGDPLCYSLKNFDRKFPCDLNLCYVDLHAMAIFMQMQVYWKKLNYNKHARTEVLVTIDVIK